jgi:prepilin-type N-terminal cleavage/methylation domain-containing protein
VNQEQRERGFTMVEVVTVVVIMGLVIAPLCMALTQAMNLIPQSSARAQAATDNDRLLATFSDDVAQTQVYVNGPANQWYCIAVNNPVCQPTTSASGSYTTPATVPAVQTLYQFLYLSWQDAGVSPAVVYQVWWRLRLSPGGGPGRMQVEVQRSTDNVTYSTYLTAYAAVNKAIAVVTTSPPLDTPADGSIGVVLQNLTDKFGTALNKIEFIAKMRAGRIDPLAPLVP